jgi:hypothetical protein
MRLTALADVSERMFVFSAFDLLTFHGDTSETDARPCSPMGP